MVKQLIFFFFLLGLQPVSALELRESMWVSGFFMLDQLSGHDRERATLFQREWKAEHGIGPEFQQLLDQYRGWRDQSAPWPKSMGTSPGLFPHLDNSSDDFLTHLTGDKVSKASIEQKLPVEMRLPLMGMVATINERWGGIGPFKSIIQKWQSSKVAKLTTKEMESFAKFLGVDFDNISIFLLWSPKHLNPISKTKKETIFWAVHPSLVTEEELATFIKTELAFLLLSKLDDTKKNIFTKEFTESCAWRTGDIEKFSYPLAIMMGHLLNGQIGPALHHAFYQKKMISPYIDFMAKQMYHLYIEYLKNNKVIDLNFMQSMASVCQDLTELSKQHSGPSTN